jgi:hypothetical protein
MRRVLLKSVKASGMLMFNAIARGGGVVAKKRAVAETTLRKRRSGVWCGIVRFLSVESNGLRQWLRWPRVSVVGKVGHDAERSGARWRP